MKSSGSHRVNDGSGQRGSDFFHPQSVLAKQKTHMFPLTEPEALSRVKLTFSGQPL